MIFRFLAARGALAARRTREVEMQPAFRRRIRPARSVFVVLVALVSSGAALGAPPPPPGGHHALTFGGDNQAGYPVTSLTDADDTTIDGAPNRLTVTMHPNPFRGETTFRLALRRDQEAHLLIYDLAGRRVRELVQPALRSGWHVVAWDGRDERGKALPAGAYVYRAVAGSQVATGKLVLLH
jgi:hypothetical protein